MIVAVMKKQQPQLNSQLSLPHLHMHDKNVDPRLPFENVALRKRTKCL